MTEVLDNVVGGASSLDALNSLWNTLNDKNATSEQKLTAGATDRRVIYKCAFGLSAHSQILRKFDSSRWTL